MGDMADEVDTSETIYIKQRRVLSKNGHGAWFHLMPMELVWT